MKKTVYTLLLSAVTLLSGCSFFEKELEELHSELDQIIEGQIIPVEDQILAVKVTIKGLENADELLNEEIGKLEQEDKRLREAVVNADKRLSEVSREIKAAILESETTLNSETETAMAAVMADLEEYVNLLITKLETVYETLGNLNLKDEALAEEIRSLIEYADSVENYSKEWALATFATLEHQGKLMEIISGIQTDHSILDLALKELDRKAVQKMEEAESLATQYLADTLAKSIAELSAYCTSEISSARSQLESSFSTELNNALDTLKSGIKNWVSASLADYDKTSAIDSKLELLRSELDAQFDEYDQSMKLRIDDLDSYINARVAANIKDVDSLHILLYSEKDLPGDIRDKYNELYIKLMAASNRIGDNALAIAANTANLKTLLDDATLENNNARIAENARLIKEASELLDTLDLYVVPSTAGINKAIGKIVERSSSIDKMASEMNANALLIAENNRNALRNQQLVDSLAERLNEIKEEISEENRGLVKTAIESYNGRLTASLVEKANALDKKVEGLEKEADDARKKLTDLENGMSTARKLIADYNQYVATLRDNIVKAANQIQSVTVVPDNAAANAVSVAEGDVKDVKFRVMSPDAAKNLVNYLKTPGAEDGLYRLDYVETMTKAADIKSIDILSISYIEEEQLVSVRINAADVREKISSSKGVSASLKLGDRDYTIASPYFSFVK
ncbi:MAG: hypothetical protein HUJ94_08000 [Bacteroidales bacterium]|nr:hypothetical protein [Bacteroidales bacterium]